MQHQVNLYQINKNDNVAVALCDIPAGVVQVRGESSLTQTAAIEKVDFGHKIALEDIYIGENIVKYGVVIGVAIKDIKQGEWVHLHNIKSNFDDKSSTLDFKTGISTSIQYIAGQVNLTKGDAL